MGLYINLIAIKLLYKIWINQSIYSIQIYIDRFRFSKNDRADWINRHYESNYFNIDFATKSDVFSNEELNFWIDTIMMKKRITEKYEYRVFFYINKLVSLDINFSTLPLIL